MPPGSNNTDYIWILKEILDIVIPEFRPQILFAEAGFDAHSKDPLSKIEVNEDFYSWIGQYLKEMMPAVISLLEGGYDLNSLANSSLNYIIAQDEEILYPENPDKKPVREDSISQNEITRNKIKYKFKEEIEKEYLEKHYTFQVKLKKFLL